MTENLYCPRCGKQFSDGTAFCRTCGLSLDGVSKIVTGEASEAPITTSRPNFKVMRIGIGLFILGLAIGLINGAVRDLGLFPDAYGKMVFLTLVAAGMLTLGAGFLFPTKKYTKRKRSDSSAQSGADTGLDTAPLAGQLSPVEMDAGDLNFPTDRREPMTVERGSVTEHTTRNLE